ncbi:uncharacterized protein PV06_11443 [Exophiala oligosperma]|uniref:Uncharacterized protein n=1 Tax=Exophiala oligosperma TaxID=215243 RepID=A0A0D2DKM2_9EURO|nr:uncharacterized protein PV06_11443 [Exophiala oligosperma]KIW36304.1 hypothetical protein PV06_11443 [Exophiala oligosperma]
MTITVYADELLRLTVDDIGDEQFFEIKDQENETEEHVAHLRKLADERDERDRSRAVDAGELGRRLGYERSTRRDNTDRKYRCLPTADSFIPSSHRHRSPSSSSLDSERDKAGAWQEQLEAHHELVADGGRPSHPITLGWDVIENSNNYEQYKDIIWFWHWKGGYYTVFFTQLMEWRRFREMQDKRRSYYIPQNRFQEYQDLVRESQTDAGWKYDLRVLEDRHQQNRLEDWNEFRAVYYRRLKQCEKRVAPAHANLLVREKEFEETQARLTDVITDTQVLYSRFSEIRASQKEVAKAQSRVESAEEALRAARQSRSKTKAELMRVAHQEIASARDNLKQVSGTEEMRRLRDGYDLHIADKVMVIARGKLRGAELDVKRWKVFLKWVDDQHSAIAAECGLFTNNALDAVPQTITRKEDPQRQKERPQLRQRKQKQRRSVLSPKASSKVSKSLKARVGSSSLRPTITTPLHESPMPAVASAQQGDHDDNRKSRLRPCPSTSPLKPTRRSARIAERIKGLQDSNALSKTARIMGGEAHELSQVKRQMEQNIKAATKSSERLKGRHPSKPQGVSKRRGPPR